ncbi:MAG TPA: porin family protein, partial [Paludibacter sp.]|nr:porin family protein [Paludibacter sp.]
MTRKNILTTLFIILSVSIFSQKKVIEPETYIGLNFGQTGSMVNFSPSVNQSYLLGYHGGLVFRYIADRHVGVQAELNYSQRGWNETDVMFARQLNYLEIPFMTHFFFGRKFRFFINLGPRVGYFISDNILTDNTINSTEVEHITDIENPFDYGFCGGLGFLFKIRKQVFQIDARANYSMSDIYSNDKRDYFDTSNNINASVSFA